MATRRWRIGIVGGSGFIGHSLAKYMSNEYHVRILDVVRPPSESHLEFQACDVRNYEEVKSQMEGLDLVIHTAIVQIPAINEQKRLGYEVNFLGTQNVCEAVEENEKVKGLIMAGSWHVIGERELKGTINEEFGFRPDKVEGRARLYALSKIAQETTVRFYDEISKKVFGVIRMGTVIGEGMPEKTALNIFIERALRGESITPFKHSMYRPMFYVDIRDICKAYEVFANRILTEDIQKGDNSIDHILNVYFPEPITVIETAEIVKDAVEKLTKGKIVPKIEIVDQGQEPLFTKDEKKMFQVNVRKALTFLGFRQLLSPRESIEQVIKERLARST